MTSFGIELELFILLLLSKLGQTLFAKFEIETQRWRQIFKWMILHGGTIGLYFLVGHWAPAASCTRPGAGSTELIRGMPLHESATTSCAAGPLGSRLGLRV